MSSLKPRIKITPRLREALELCGVLLYHSNLRSFWYGIKNYDYFRTIFDKSQELCVLFCLFCRCRLRRELPPCVVDGVISRQDQLADGQHGVALVDEVLQNTWQRLRRVEGGIVEQHDAAGLHLGRHPLAYRVRIVVLPVQGVPIGNDLKPLRHKGLRVWQPDFLPKEYSSPLGIAALPLKNYKRFPAEMTGNRFFYGSRR